MISQLSIFLAIMPLLSLGSLTLASPIAETEVNNTTVVLAPSEASPSTTQGMGFVEGRGDGAADEGLQVYDLTRVTAVNITVGSSATRGLDRRKKLMVHWKRMILNPWQKAEIVDRRPKCQTVRGPGFLWCIQAS
ncbi:hypothetical protein BKA64DRAFT_33898 [Cadophora sp. MPI-SDFR-AT-0126]|nr:hypothetical protein BKA64DRAFT_33898 [Leotiomycetes sp. MPI-SDFR-AT-0126]